MVVLFYICTTKVLLSSAVRILTHLWPVAKSLPSVLVLALLCVRVAILPKDVKQSQGPLLQTNWKAGYN